MIIRIAHFKLWEIMEWPISTHQMLRHIFQIRDSIPTQELDCVLMPLKLVVISILSHDSVYGTVLFVQRFFYEILKRGFGWVDSTTTRKKNGSMN
jgi:hypothetical protein